MAAEADARPWDILPDRIPPAVRASSEPFVRFFSYHDAHPSALVFALLKAFEVDWITWEPEVLRDAILEHFHATSVSPNNWAKIQACRTLLQTTGFWTEWEIFEKIIQALNNNLPHFSMLQPCTVPQLMAGVAMAHDIRQEDQWSGELKCYVAACAQQYGVTYLPPPLEFAQEKLVGAGYWCRTCGNLGDADTPDGRCDVCTKRYVTRQNLTPDPDPDVLPNEGRDLVTFVRRDPAAVRARYEEWKSLDSTLANEEDVVDLQAVKLVVAYRYMLKREREKVQQLKELAAWIAR